MLTSNSIIFFLDSNFRFLLNVIDNILLFVNLFDIKYDNYFRSQLIFTKLETRQKYIREGMESIVDMFEVTEAEEGDTPK